MIDEFDASQRYSCDVLLWNNTHDFRSDMLSSFPNLKVFINWGTDDANLKDEDELQKRVLVKKVDFYSQQSVCEYVLMLIIAFERSYGMDARRNTDERRQLYGKKIGIIGMGKIGFGIANMLHRSFHCTIYYNTTIDYQIPDFHFTTPQELVKNCDYLILAPKSKKCVLDPSMLRSANGDLVILNISRDSVMPFVHISPFIREGRVRGFIGDVTKLDVQTGTSRNIMIVPKIGHQTKEAIEIKQNTVLYYLKQFRLLEQDRRSYVYIARHGKTEWNTLKIYQGTHNSALTDEGKEQISKIGLFLSDKRIGHIFASPLGRARETAEIIARQLDVPITIIPAFSEMDFGIFQKRSQESVKELFEDFFRSHHDNLYYKLFVPYPAGESYYDVYLRVLPEVLALLATYDDFLIVGHESVNRIIRGVIQGIPLIEMTKTKQKNNEIAVLEISQNTVSTFEI